MEMKKIKPAIYQGPLGWGWVYFRELCEIKKMTTYELWGKFFYFGMRETMAIVYDDEDMFPTQQLKVFNVDVEIGIVVSREDMVFGEFYVPAGWALDVLEPERLAKRIELYSINAPSVVPPAYVTASVILPDGQIKDLPCGNELHDGGPRILEPKVPLMKSLGHIGINPGTKVDIRVSIEGFDFFLEGITVPADDTEWWQEEWESKIYRDPNY